VNKPIQTTSRICAKILTHHFNVQSLHITHSRLRNPLSQTLVSQLVVYQIVYGDQKSGNIHFRDLQLIVCLVT
jgi:hypothetical protein